MDFADYFPNGIVINGIIFDASAATDVAILRHKTATGVQLVKLVGNSSVAFAIPFRCHPYMAKADQTLTTPSQAVLIINLA